ncbi:MAG TPA: hypothetical protein VJ787_10530 [Thermoleophilia bacterium]|nr:hypothetical protein [Thermoleophilia bacterium]
MSRTIFFIVLALVAALGCTPNAGGSRISCDCRCTPNDGLEAFCLAPDCRIDGRTCAPGANDAELDLACEAQCAQKSDGAWSCRYVREIEGFVGEPDAFPAIEAAAGLAGQDDG